MVIHRFRPVLECSSPYSLAGARPAVCSAAFPAAGDPRVIVRKCVTVAHLLNRQRLSNSSTVFGALISLSTLRPAPRDARPQDLGLEKIRFLLSCRTFSFPHNMPVYPGARRVADRAAISGSLNR